MLEYKTCSKCGKIKTANLFSKASKMSDGLRSSCKECNAKTLANWVNKRRIASETQVPPLSKKCSLCGLIKPNTEFRPCFRERSGLRSRCYKCEREDNRRSRERRPHAGRQQKLKSNFGISLEEYNALLEKQSGVCAICEQPETVSRFGKIDPLSVDHDHKTGKVRGLLCQRCNLAIGLMGDSTSKLRNAIAYLGNTP